VQEHFDVMRGRIRLARPVFGQQFETSTYAQRREKGRLNSLWLSVLRPEQLLEITPEEQQP
jgi:hypothetical protein